MENTVLKFAKTVKASAYVCIAFILVWAAAAAVTQAQLEEVEKINGIPIDSINIDICVQFHNVAATKCLVGEGSSLLGYVSGFTASGQASRDDKGTLKIVEKGKNDSQLVSSLEEADAATCFGALDMCVNICQIAQKNHNTKGYLNQQNPDATEIKKAEQTVEVASHCNGMTTIAAGRLSNSFLARMNVEKYKNIADQLTGLNSSRKSGISGMISDNALLAVGATAAVTGALAFKMGKDKGKKSGYKKGLNDGLTAHEEVCFKQGKWDTPECKDEYLLACKDDPKREGCYAFTNTYCGMGGAKSATATGQGTTYCDEMAEHRYCESAGNANSPSCVENRIQSGVCQQQKANNPDLICQMYAHQQLAESICADFPNDPKCLNIIISNQGTSMSSSSTTSQSTVVPVINTNTTSVQSTSTQSTAPTSGTVVRQSDGSYIVVYGAQSASTQSTGGSTTVQSYGEVGSANSNLLQNLSIDISSACNQGTLVGCYQSPSFR